VPIEKALEGVDGLVLTGGADVDPSRYGESRHPSFEDAEPGRDEYETGLVLRAIEKDLPVLAICRGAQVLNVALGGSLIQDIPSQSPSAIDHASQSNVAKAHLIEMAPGSLLAKTLGSASNATDGSGLTYAVNSRHHQSVKQPGRGLRVSAVAPDGIVEAIEKPDAAFCLGVQWHPENFWSTGEFRPLFEAFLDACRSRRERAADRRADRAARL
jgi:putative glutamine amidotransferase